MALENLDFKRPNWSHLGRTGWEKERRRGRRRRIQAKIKLRYGTLDFWYGNYLDHGIEWILGTLRLCMINIMSPNLAFSLNCILTLDFLKLRWVKPIRNKINKESSPLRWIHG